MSTTETACHLTVNTVLCSAYHTVEQFVMNLMRSIIAKFYGLTSVRSLVLPTKSKLDITSTFPHCQAVCDIPGLVQSSSPGLFQANQHSCHILWICHSPLQMPSCSPPPPHHRLSSLRFHLSHCLHLHHQRLDSGGSSSNPYHTWGSVPLSQAIGV